MNLASTTPRFLGGLSLDTKQLEILTEPRGWTDQRGVLLEGVVVENLNHPITMRALHDFLHVQILSRLLTLVKGRTMMCMASKIYLIHWPHESKRGKGLCNRTPWHVTNDKSKVTCSRCAHLLKNSPDHTSPEA